MKELIESNLDKLIPAVERAGNTLGQKLGDRLNTAIDKGFEKMVKILISTTPIK